MYRTDDLRSEAKEAFERIWFIQSVGVVERTDQTLSIRLMIRADLFVQAFVGEITGSLYFALIEGRQRIFGVDRDAGEWHVHPFGEPEEHLPLAEGMEPKPLMTFLSQVEKLLLEQDLL